jgi:hypothetical protein
VTKYEDLLKRQSILDLVVWREKVYVCVASGSVTMFRVEPKEEALVLETTLKMQNTERLAEGYFVVLADRMLWVNKDFAFEVGEKKVSQLGGYKNNSNFESVEYIEAHKLLAVAEGTDGVSFYRYDDGALTLVNSLNETFFKTKVDISDVACIDQDVYILNRLGGILRMRPDNSSSWSLWPT